jgi:hypothetical protein
VLVAGERAHRQRRKICGACDADRDRRLSRLFPGDARRRIAALGNVDQLDERIDMVGIDVRGRRRFDLPNVVTNQPGVAPLADLSMIILTGGRERTIDEYGDLFAAAGFRLTRATPTNARLVIMEAETSRTGL